MCLNTISKRKPRKTGFGWKSFELNEDGKLIGDVMGEKIRPINEWLKESDYRRTWCCDPLFTDIELIPYPFGWHISKKRKDVRSYAGVHGHSISIRKVQYRKAHTVGVHDFNGEKSSCIVAKEIKILPLKGE